MTTRILALADASGNLVRFRLMPWNRCDSVDVPPLIEGIAFEGLIADKAFDSNVVLFAKIHREGLPIRHLLADMNQTNDTVGIPSASD